MEGAILKSSSSVSGDPDGTSQDTNMKTSWESSVNNETWNDTGITTENINSQGFSNQHLRYKKSYIDDQGFEGEIYSDSVFINPLSEIGNSEDEFAVIYIGKNSNKPSFEIKPTYGSSTNASDIDDLSLVLNSSGSDYYVLGSMFYYDPNNKTFTSNLEIKNTYISGMWRTSHGFDGREVLITFMSTTDLLLFGILIKLLI